MSYSTEIYKKLVEKFRSSALHRPMHIDRYEPGTELKYDIIGVEGANRATVRMVIEKFVGGGFAGQVYRVKILDIEPEGKPVGGLAAGGIYAIKILIPPTLFSRLFRNALYWFGFQGPFQLQVNPSAARSGALWQKFIRRGAKIMFGDERSVVDIYATFIDSRLGSCGELSEWVEGRTWRLEVDDRLDLLNRWSKGKDVDTQSLGSPEYRAKYEFMNKFVDLLHQMGGHEFARQYEWSTWKSQPNCMKRNDTEESPSGGLTAVDFRAGLVLLPFLPMSPGDFKLIFKGLMRGSLVQFDRGDLKKLDRFVEAHSAEFAGMESMLEELKSDERVYRDSVPDITHNHVRLLYSPRLWSTILSSAATGWKIRNLIDEPSRKKLLGNKPLTLLIYVLFIIPLIGRVSVKFWGHPDWRKHYREMLTSRNYFGRAFRGKIIEKIIGWHRSGRFDDNHAMKFSQQLWRIVYHLPLSVLPAGIHRLLTDWRYAKERLAHIFIRPVRLYFDNDLREQWLHEMVEDGKKKHLLNNEDADIILSRIKEPYIQKYLKSLAVHVCTLPVTQVVSVLVAIIYVALHPEMPRTQSYSIGLGIIALFQVLPISPGSLTRGFYVLYLVIKERNFKDYNIAVFLGFFKYIGYLAFPIQMTYHYPALAQFMAGYWATEAVHIIPVFGERGALLEHRIFCLFYNWPLTIRRRMERRGLIRASLKPRYWHIVPYALAGAGLFGALDFMFLRNVSELPNLKELWIFALIVPLLTGAAVTLSSGGTAILKRIISGAICGGSMGLMYIAVSSFLGYGGQAESSVIAIEGAWRVFVFTVLSAIGVLLTEMLLPDPKKR